MRQNGAEEDGNREEILVRNERTYKQIRGNVLEINLKSIDESKKNTLRGVCGCEVLALSKDMLH